MVPVSAFILILGLEIVLFCTEKGILQKRGSEGSSDGEFALDYSAGSSVTISCLKNARERQKWGWRAAWPQRRTGRMGVKASRQPVPASVRKRGLEPGKRAASPSWKDKEMRPLQALPPPKEWRHLDFTTVRHVSGFWPTELDDKFDKFGWFKPLSLKNSLQEQMY